MKVIEIERHPLDWYLVVERAIDATFIRSAWVCGLSNAKKLANLWRGSLS